MIPTEHVVRIAQSSASKPTVIIIRCSSHIVIHILDNIIGSRLGLTRDAHILNGHIHFTLELFHSIAAVILIAAGSKAEQKIHNICAVIHFIGLCKLSFVDGLRTAESIFLTRIRIVCTDPSHRADRPGLAHGRA